MAYTARLTHGAHYLELDGGTYALGRGFSPPATPEMLTTAGGTSANRRGGAELIGKRAGNRAWTLPVRVMGASSAEVERAIVNLDQFLQQAGDESNPIYFEYLPNADVGFEPVWGQTGAWLRTEIVGATGREKWTEFTAGSIRERAVFVYIPLEIKPYALGNRQRLASAIGGVLEDVLGAANGLSRGLIIAEANGTGGNEITNPMFGHPTTWNNDWTASNAALIGPRNTDANFILFGSLSVKLTNTGAAVYNYRQSINTADVNTHALSCYVKLPDGSAVSATQCQLFYNVALTTTYTAIGDGWYRLTASVTGINGATNTGLQVAVGYTVYADGFQFEEQAYPTALYYGDMLGCAWAGTAHDSASTRTAGRVRIDGSQFSPAEGSARIVWTPAIANTAIPAASNIRLLETTGTTLRLLYDDANTRWQVYDGANTANGSTATFAAGTPIVVHVIWGPGQLKAYVNGAISVNGGTYTPQAAPAYIYIGTNTAAGQHANGTFGGFTLFERAMSAAEVLADYNNVGQVAANGERVDWIPWLWTKDGDNIVDQADDSSYDNFAVVGGVPGHVEAETEWLLYMSNAIDPATYYLGRTDYPAAQYAAPTAVMFYKDYQGVADATCSGGEYQQISVDTSVTGLSYSTANPELFPNRLTHYFVRIYDAGSNLQLAPFFEFDSTGGAPIIGDYQAVAADTTWRLFYAGQIYVHQPALIRALASEQVLFIGWKAKRSSGVAANIRLDVLLIIPGPVLKIKTRVGATTRYIRLLGREALWLSSTSDLNDIATVTGAEVVELLPERTNLVYWLTGDGEAHVITDATTFSAVFVTPRWSLT